MPPSAANLLSVNQAAADGELRCGDVLLFRGRSIVARAIGVAGRSAYSHAAMLGIWRGTAMVMEVREFVGGRLVTLDSQVARYSGQIDVFTVRGRAYYRYQAVDAMLRLAGCEYGYWGVARAALAHLPIVRWRLAPQADDLESWDGSAPFCSQGVAMAMRAGEVDPVPNLADRSTEPGDLARSAALEYRCTLVSGERIEGGDP